MPDASRYIFEGSVAIVVIKVCDDPGGKSSRAADDRHAFPRTIGVLTGLGSARMVELEVVRDEQIQMAVAIIIDPGCA